MASSGPQPSAPRPIPGAQPQQYVYPGNPAAPMGASPYSSYPPPPAPAPDSYNPPPGEPYTAAGATPYDFGPGAAPQPSSYPSSSTYQPPVPSAYPAQQHLNPKDPFAPPPASNPPFLPSNAPRPRGFSGSSSHSFASHRSGESPRRRPFIPEYAEPTSYPPGPGSRFGSTSPHRGPPPSFPPSAYGGPDPRSYDAQNRRMSLPSAQMGNGFAGSHPGPWGQSSQWSFAPRQDYHRRRTSEGCYGYGRRPRRYDDSSDSELEYEDRRQYSRRDDDGRRSHRRGSRDRRRRKSASSQKEALKEEIERKPTMGDSLMAAVHAVKKAL